MALTTDTYITEIKERIQNNISPRNYIRFYFIDLFTDKPDKNLIRNILLGLYKKKITDSQLLTYIILELCFEYNLSVTEIENIYGNSKPFDMLVSLFIKNPNWNISLKDKCVKLSDTLCSIVDASLYKDIALICQSLKKYVLKTINHKEFQNILTSLGDVISNIQQYKNPKRSNVSSSKSIKLLLILIILLIIIVILVFVFSKQK